MIYKIKQDFKSHPPFERHNKHKVKNEHTQLNINDIHIYLFTNVCKRLLGEIITFKFLIV